MTACLLCGAPTGPMLDGVTDTRFGAPGRYDIRRCGACGLVQTDPVPSPAELKALYERYYNFGGEGASGYGRARERAFASRLYRLWLALDGDVSFHAVNGSGRLIDIGCNEGRGLERYRANGFDAEGLELNAHAAAVARARGFAVHEVDLAAFRPERPFDRAVLSNVLEHATDPRAMLRDVHRILAPGGEAWISLPNVESWQAGAFGRAWINWHVPYHVTHFSAARLDALLRETGFAPVAVHGVSPALWFAQSLLVRLRGDGRLLRRRWLVAGTTLAARALLFAPLWLNDRAGRGDCLVVRARRP